jgi:hypothetical protein
MHNSALVLLILFMHTQLSFKLNLNNIINNTKYLQIMFLTDKMECIILKNHVLRTIGFILIFYIIIFLIILQCSKFNLRKISLTLKKF